MDLDASTNALPWLGLSLVINIEGIEELLNVFACVERCPRGVEPAKVIEAVRLEVIRQQGRNRLKPDDIPAKLDEDLPGQLLMTAMRKYTK